MSDQWSCGSRLRFDSIQFEPRERKKKAREKKTPETNTATKAANESTMRLKCLEQPQIDPTLTLPRNFGCKFRPNSTLLGAHSQHEHLICGRGLQFIVFYFIHSLVSRLWHAHKLIPLSAAIVESGCEMNGGQRTPSVLPAALADPATAHSHPSIPIPHRLVMSMNERQAWRGEFRQGNAMQCNAMHDEDG